ncbi:uncharacterized protein ACN2A1_006580 [Glossina fuscipes fuscipes]
MSTFSRCDLLDQSSSKSSPLNIECYTNEVCYECLIRKLHNWQSTTKAVTDDDDILCEERPRRHVAGNNAKAKRRKKDDGDPQTAAAFDQHLLLCFNCKTQRAKDGKSQHKAGDYTRKGRRRSFERQLQHQTDEERSKRSKGAGNQRRLSWDLRDTENEKVSTYSAKVDNCDCEILSEESWEKYCFLLN